MSEPVTDEGGARLYSTISKRRETLVPGEDGTVGIYVCGPTVYGRIHIGNARPFVVFSVLKRFLERRGVRVRFVSNLTDVNDKIYDAARAEGVPSSDLARRYCDAYVADTDRLGLGRPDAEPRVTDSVPEIIALIERLVERGLAYPAEGDVYFRVERFEGYGKLSGRRLEDMVSGEPGAGKESHLDFALWKGRKPDEDTWWESPWGPGRPGWHIECSAMAESALGRCFQVHGGGIDLVFPHHENEIAQSEGAHGGCMAQIWMHNEMLELGDEKMSKSLGNIAPLGDVLDRWPAEVVIAYFLTSHYRSKLPFSDERMADARAVVERLTNALRALDRAMAAGGGDGHDPDLTRAVVEGRREFFRALDDDFGTPEAFAALFEMVRGINRATTAGLASAAQMREARHELLELLDVLGLAGIDPGPADDVPAAVVSLLAEREQARAGRDFAGADALRDRVRELGFEITDGPGGPQATRIAEGPGAT
jgi:cysteinyl-tRNA synthetase